MIVSTNPKTRFLYKKGGTDASTTTANLDTALEQLQLEYVDLMLVHFPATWGGKGGAALRKEEWLAMEK